MMTPISWVNVENIGATKVPPNKDVEAPQQKPKPRCSGSHQTFCTVLVYKAKDKVNGLWVDKSKTWLHSHSDHLEPDSRVCYGGNLLLVVGVLLVFMLMVMLLLWNYKCIVVDQFCEGNREMLTPVFRDN